MNFPVESQQVKEALERASSVLAISHANPDADAVASLISFKLAFEAPNRPISLALGKGTIPENLEFLPDVDAINPVADVQIESFDLIAFLDCADEARVGPEGEGILRSATGNVPVINIDHHVTNSCFGSINLIDAEAAASCEILQLLYEDLGITISAAMATVLLAGVQGDTLGLRTPSTTGRTLEASARLLRTGADLDTIVDYLFRIRPYSTLKLWAQALSKAQFTGNLIWTEITQDMLEASEADESEAEGIVNFLAGTRGARAAAMLYRKPDGWRVSMRSISDDVDVSQLAGLFGGGGHSRAAGCSLSGDVSERDSFLETISQRISIGARNPVAGR